MRKTAYIVLFGSLGLTGFLIAIWLLGFIFVTSFGSLVHLFLVLAILSSFGVIVGLIMLLVSHLKK